MTEAQRSYVAPAHFDLKHERFLLEHIIANGLDTALDALVEELRRQGTDMTAPLMYVELVGNLAREAENIAERLAALRPSTLSGEAC